MKKRGEITVFLSLVVVCILSLCMGLLESARTAGSRLYAQMAAESAVSSVMSQYNRNLWDVYHLLFLETESEEAVEQSFSKYMDFYCDQENFYPMKLEEVRMVKGNSIIEKGGKWLEDGAVSYVNYRLPDVAEDLLGIVDEAEQAKNAGDFRELFEVCSDAGKKARKLEKSRMKIEECLSDMREYRSKLSEAVDRESEGQFETYAGKFEKEIKQFSRYVNAYEKEVQKVTDHLEELRERQLSAEFGAESKVSGHISQEIAAYEQVELSAEKELSEYRNYAPILEDGMTLLDEALDLLEEERYEYVYVGSTSGNGENGSSGSSGDENCVIEEDVYEMVELGPDWDAIGGIIGQLEIPGEIPEHSVDHEKASLLDQLEEIFQGDLLDLVLPKETEVSRNYVSLKEIPSKTVETKTAVSGEAVKLSGEESVMRQVLVNEYCFLSFDSFLEKCVRKIEVKNQPLSYEQEYLLCGQSSDRENLAKTVEKLLTIRGSMNLFCLLQSPEKRAEADTLAAAVSGGNAPVKFILSFFILTMWAFGEAVLDVKGLLNGDRVPFWKQPNQWNVSLEKLLSLEFLKMIPVKSSEDGRDYQDHLRILFFLMKVETRNYRMMDVIQWNIRTMQEDFAVNDCFSEIEIEADLRECHVFLLTNEYQRTIRTVGAY